MPRTCTARSSTLHTVNRRTPQASRRPFSLRIELTLATFPDLLQQYTVPKVKFALHFLSHISLCAYATSLFLILKDDFTAARITGERVPIPASEIIYWVWCLSRIVGEVCDIPDMSLRGILVQLQDPFNRIDYMIIALNIISTSIRLCVSATAADFVPPTMQQLPMDLYAVVLAFNYYRFLQYLRIYRSIGVLSLVLDSLMMGNLTGARTQDP
eukprot:1490869-Prymnesium_polylepis.2